MQHEVRIALPLRVECGVVARVIRAERTVEAHLGDRRPEAVEERLVIAAAAGRAQDDAVLLRAPAFVHAGALAGGIFDGAGRLDQRRPECPNGGRAEGRTGHVLVGVQVGDAAGAQLAFVRVGVRRRAE